MNTFTLVRSIDGIPADDYEPVTTLNIDTPEYNQLMHVDRLFTILQGFGLASSDVKRVDVLLKVEAFDAANSQAYEFLTMRARGQDFVVGTGKVGSGLIRPIVFSAGLMRFQSLLATCAPK